MDEDAINGDDNLDGNKEQLESFYIKTQLSEYMIRLEQDLPVSIESLSKPTSDDANAWLLYIENIREKYEEIRREFEWKLVEGLIEHTYMILQEAGRKPFKFKSEQLKKKWVKEKIVLSIPKYLSKSSKTRYNQAYDHIYDVIVTFENNKIPKDIWLPI
ncbi:7868_t:CDS:2 [Dentiscutata erythropus]|uniref:7868_t:CDS:1 n=1 Tax=Dentiscutata erythropus TaxID=1348616 RepID=A0A9N9NQR8_9GLOM|nr:7868_t:CDS:2 [Dentiscutata erythropus]